MDSKFKIGDIVYFKSEYKAVYGRQGGSYDYYFKPGDRYQINGISDGFVLTGTITNLEDSKSHFAHSSIWEKLITVDEWRELQLEKLNV